MYRNVVAQNIAPGLPSDNAGDFGSERAVGYLLNDKGKGEEFAPVVCV
jgi:hypothetical protein